MKAVPRRAEDKEAVAAERGANSGRLHLKLLSEEHLFQVGVIPTCCETFVLHADLQRMVVLQQTQSGAAEDAEVHIGMASSQAGLIFLQGHVELPMEAVLDRPVAADGGGELPRGELLAHDDVVPHLVAASAVSHRVADGPADGRQFRPPP